MKKYLVYTSYEELVVMTEDDIRGSFIDFENDYLRNEMAELERYKTPKYKENREGDFTDIKNIEEITDSIINTSKRIKSARDCSIETLIRDFSRFYDYDFYNNLQDFLDNTTISEVSVCLDLKKFESKTMTRYELEKLQDLFNLNKKEVDEEEQKRILQELQVEYDKQKDKIVEDLKARYEYLVGEIDLSNVLDKYDDYNISWCAKDDKVDYVMIEDKREV